MKLWKDASGRAMSALLALVMCFSVLPRSASAADVGVGPGAASVGAADGGEAPSGGVVPGYGGGRFRMVLKSRAANGVPSGADAGGTLVLPKTGGMGTAPLSAAGSTLILSAGLLLAARRKAGGSGGSPGDGKGDVG